MALEIEDFLSSLEGLAFDFQIAGPERKKGREEVREGGEGMSNSVVLCFTSGALG